MTIESHPLQPFLPSNARVLMLGSFPPPRARWSMDFFYPNYINDMWRIMGHIFFADRQHFVDETHRTFRLNLIIPFLEAKGIALYDTATSVRRLKDNASDKFLETAESTDIHALTNRLPHLQAIATTGQKATETLLETLQFHSGAIEPPAIGSYTPFQLHNRPLRFYRMPSTSRAYPLPLDKKADHYVRMFRELGMLEST
ncbi:MAG: uracil-DNA glycosylase family protein [Alloprevotella sp.]|nr:uracil-DNA glycosylase family protein [Prevotella sp.]MBR1712896.1 uracil-DNA glycosylase family protein [Alloprevotella sp.]